MDGLVSLGSIAAFMRGLPHPLQPRLTPGSGMSDGKWWLSIGWDVGIPNSSGLLMAGGTWMGDTPQDALSKMVRQMSGKAVEYRTSYTGEQVHSYTCPVLVESGDHQEFLSGLYASAEHGSRLSKLGEVDRRLSTLEQFCFGAFSSERLSAVADAVAGVLSAPVVKS